MITDWFPIAGILAQTGGAFLIGWELILTKERASELATAKYGRATLKHPQVQDRLRQSRNAVIGLVLIVLGGGLQIVAGWPAQPAAATAPLSAPEGAK